MAYISDITIKDSANLDSFSRLRVATPQGLFDGQFTYNLLPLQFETVTSSIATCTASHDSTNRCANLSMNGAASSSVNYMQSYEYVRYQPGRSQVSFITFNFSSSLDGVTKFAGNSDGINGIEFQLSGSVPRVAILSGTQRGNEFVTQPNWNLDKLDGSGSSGITLNIVKTQILVIDFQALYVGRVRIGFDIGGNVVYVHEFNHANIENFSYIQYATLPVRVGMNTAVNSTITHMSFICSAVISEGGQEENGGVPNAIEGTGTAGNNSFVHILSLRPKTTFNSLTNRNKVVLDSVEITVTGTPAIVWQLVIGQAISGTTTFNDVNTVFSSCEYNTLGTISGSAALVTQSGYCISSNSTKGLANPKISSKIPITLSQAALVRANGTISVLASGFGGTSACRAILNWRELR